MRNVQIVVIGLFFFSSGLFAAPGHRADASVRSNASPIAHVVYIIQRNRSFNNLFMGFPGAETQDYGYDTSGTRIRLHAQSIATKWDIDHSTIAFFTDYDGGNVDGWNREAACCDQPKNFAYAYAPRSETKTYWEMAEQYVLADHVFSSNLDGSFITHQYAIAAYANHEFNGPTGPPGCEGGPSDVIGTLAQVAASVPVCQNYATLGDELDHTGLTWRYYTYRYGEDGGDTDAYSAIRHIYFGQDYLVDVVDPASRFISDVGNGRLAAVSWITPTGENSDHAGFESKGGPAWVASLVNAVGQSPFWDSTVVFVIWDNWGGWFDPIRPVFLDYDGPGFRVPLIAISAYSKTGKVSHVRYESSSVLRFIEDNFGLAPLAASDRRAADPANDFFDFSKPPRRFTPF